MSEKIAVWNTGAHYTEHGQRISATIVDAMDEYEKRRYGIVFVDYDRGIDGFIALTPGARVRDLRQQTQHNYDYGNYTGAYIFSAIVRELRDAIVSKD